MLDYELFIKLICKKTILQNLLLSVNLEHFDVHVCSLNVKYKCYYKKNNKKLFHRSEFLLRTVVHQVAPRPQPWWYQWTVTSMHQPGCSSTTQWPSMRSRIWVSPSWLFAPLTMTSGLVAVLHTSVSQVMVVLNIFVQWLCFFFNNNSNLLLWFFSKIFKYF